MLDTDRQVCEFRPRGRREALAWFWGCGDYPLKDALSLRPLEVAPSQVRRCLRVRGRRGDGADDFIVDFTQAQHNRIVVSRLPAGFPLRIVEDGRGLEYLRLLVREQLAALPRGLTMFWFLVAFAALLALQAAAPYLAPALARRAASPQCAGSCPALAAHGTLIVATGLIPLLLGLVLPPLRYGWLLSRGRLSAVMRATVRTELLLLPCLNLFFLSVLAWRAAASPSLAAVLRAVFVR
jgi:hypothetical protein